MSFAARQALTDKANAQRELLCMRAEDSLSVAVRTERKLQDKEQEARKMMAIVAVRAARVGSERLALSVCEVSVSTMTHCFEKFR